MLEVLGKQPVQHAVDPVVVPPVRLSLHAFADVAGALGVADRAIVEAVDLQLEPVVAELLEEVALELARGLLADPPAAEARMDGEPAEARDPAAAVADLEPERPRRRAVDLDHEDAVLLRLALGAFDRLEQRLAVLRPHCGEEGLDFLVVHELDEEVDVVGSSSPNDACGVTTSPRTNLDSFAVGFVLGFVSHGMGSTTGVARLRAGRQTPDPSATPPRIRPSPTSIVGRSGSLRISAP